MVDLDSIAARVARRLIARGETIAVAESSAGGLISAALLAVPGASAYFLGGAIIYTGAARLALLGIGPDEMAGMRPSSQPYAALLARTVRTKFAADWGLSETGATGPTGNRYGDAAGHACIGLDGSTPRVCTIETGTSDRAGNMRAFAAAALQLLDSALG
jgi:PncC family amidohydrolase